MEVEGNVRPFFANYQKQNPLRPADWRWQRASSLHADGRGFSRLQDDLATKRALNYLRGRARCRTKRELQRLARRHQQLDPAFELSLKGGDARMALEARLLAGQTPDEIAAACALSPGAVIAFEQTFFNVTDRLAARTWVQLAVLGSLDVSGSPVDPVHRLVRRLAYHGGLLVLELVLRALPSLRQATRLVGRGRVAGDDPDLDGLTRRLRVLLLAESLRSTDSRALRTLDFPTHTRVSQLADWDQILAPHVASALDALLERDPDLCGSAGESTGPGTPTRQAVQVA